MSRISITANGNYFFPGIPSGREFAVAVSGTFNSRTVKVQYPTAGPATASLAVDDDTEEPAFTITAATPGPRGNDISIEILAADGVRSAIVHTVDTTGEESLYSFSPATDAGTASSLTTALTGTHNDLVFTARTAGTDGDDITIAYIDPEDNDQALSVEVTDTDIVVNLATDDEGTITTTANQLRQAIIESAAASALVSCAFASSNNGTGVVTALAETALDNGVDPVIATTSAELVDYINANCAGAFTAALATTGEGLVVATAETALAGGTNGTFADFDSGETGDFTAGGERIFLNPSDLPGINLNVAGSGDAPAITAIVTKTRADS